MGLYEKIKDIAMSKNISIAQLERDTKMSNGSISKWSKNAPSADKLSTVARYLNVSTDYLLDNKVNKNTNIKNEITRPKVKILSRKMEDLDDSQLDVINALIDQYFDKKFGKNDNEN